MKYRKPDLDLEGFRAWVVDEKKDAKKSWKEIDLKVKYKDLELGFVGFNAVFTDIKSKKQPIFAWKIRYDKKMVLYYIFENEKFPQRIKNEINAISEGLKIATNNLGLEMINAKDTIKSIYHERHTIQNLKKTGGDSK